tara:strand:+ start:2879 stop:3649 length:771 start_codon:yes stop_codon:yes gene_type:complete
VKISLAIPSTINHFRTIEPIINFYLEGATIPDEIIISVSNGVALSEEEVKKIKSLNTEIDIKVLLAEHILTHGPNRQNASNHCSGDIIIYGDADDIPHPQRIECIKYCFQKTDAVHVNHWWCPEHCQFANFDLDDVKIILSKEINDKMIEPHKNLGYPPPGVPPRGGYGGLFGRVTGGNTAIRREVLKDIRWKDWDELQGAPAEDWLFCYETAVRYRKSVILPIDLIKYISPSALGLWNNPHLPGGPGNIKSIGIL